MNEECYEAYGRCPRRNYGLIWNNDFDYEDYGLEEVKERILVAIS